MLYTPFFQIIVRQYHSKIELKKFMLLRSNEKKINMKTETSQNNSCYTTLIHNKTYGRQKKHTPKLFINYVTNYIY